MPRMQTVFDRISLTDRDSVLTPREPIAVPEDRVAAVQDINDWLLQEGIFASDIETLLDGFRHAP
jgi:hypothetical protein